MSKGFESRGANKRKEIEGLSRRDFLRNLIGTAVATGVLAGAAVEGTRLSEGESKQEKGFDDELAAEAAFDAEEDTHFDQKKFDEVEKGPYGLQATLRKLTKLNEYQGEEGHSLSQTDLKEIARQQERVRKLNLRINSLRSMHLTQKLEHLRGEKE